MRSGSDINRVLIPLLLLLGSSCGLTFRAPKVPGVTSVSSLVIAPPIANNQSLSVNYENPTAVSLSGTVFGGRTIAAYSIIAGPVNGTLSGTAPNLTYTPKVRFNGTDSITFTINDGTVDSATATVDITILSGSWIQSALGSNASLAPLTTVDLLNSAVYAAYAFTSPTLTLKDSQGTSTYPFTNSSSTGANLVIGKYTDAGHLEWSLDFSSASSILASVLTTDSLGNLIVSGTSVGNWTVSDSQGTSLAAYTTTGAQDVFLAKISPAGQLLWSRLFTASGSQALRSARLLSDGSTLIHGTFSGSSLVIESESSTLSGLSLAGTNSSFLVRIASNGQIGWARRIGGAGNNGGGPGLFSSESFGVANVVFQAADVTTVSVVDSSNTVLGTTSAGGTTNGVVATSLNLSNGNLNWIRVFNAAASTTFSFDDLLPSSQSFDASGNFQMSVAANNTSGAWTGTFRLADGSIVTTFPTIGYGWDHTVFNLSPAGALLWAVSIRGSSSSTTWYPGMWRDSSDHTYISGTLLGSAALQVFNLAGTQILPNISQTSGATSSYIVKLDSSGAVSFATVFNRAASVAATSDDSGNVYWAGTGTLSLAIRETTGALAVLANSGGQDAYIVKLSASGALNWAYDLGSPGTDTVSLRVDPASGDAMVMGTFPSGPLTVKDKAGTLVQSVVQSGGLADAYLGVFNDTGLKWIHRLSGGTVQVSHASSAALGNTFSVYGTFTDSTLVNADALGASIGQMSGTGSTDIFAAQIGIQDGATQFLPLPHGPANASILSLVPGTDRLIGISTSTATALSFGATPVTGLSTGAWQLFGIQPIENP